MEIPESISKLSIDGQADIFTSKIQQTDISINDVINVIRQKTELVNYKHFEEGLVSYKQNINLDKNFIKNLLTVYSTAISKALQGSSVSDDIKPAIIKNYKAIIDGLITNIEAAHELAITLNKDENIIDVQQISYIILGYVIDTIKKYNETRSRS